MSESYCREVVEPPTKLFACFIDFVKAFDKVRHNEVLEPLMKPASMIKNFAFNEISSGNKKQR